MPAHVIYQQKLQFHLPDSADGALLSQAEHVLLSPAMQDGMATALHQALAGTGLLPDEWVTLEHLHLDLGTFPAEDLAVNLLTTMPRRLGEQVATHLRAQPAGLPLGAVPAAEATVAAWVHFLRYGTLPVHWPVPTSTTSWERELRAVLHSSPRLPQAVQIALGSAAVRLRLVRQFSPALSSLIFRRLLEGHVDAAAPAWQLARVLGQLLRPVAPATRHLTPALAAAIELALATNSAPVVGQAAPTPASLSAAAREAFALALLARAADATPGAPWAAVGAVLRSGSSLAPRPGLLSAAPEKQDVAPGRPGTPSALSAGLPSATPLVDYVEGAPSALSAGLPLPQPQTEYVANAGLVLLHPFLPACFAACGWLDEEQQFINPTAQARAVLLLHFLATGRGQAPEYELRLPQLLCGVPPGAPPPPRRLTLGWPARAEGRALLRAAVAHWSALRNTSPASLRTGFLQREGKLEGAPHPTLTVATQAQDVLLSRLPYGWGVSLVQLPWLAHPLPVDWA